MGTVKMTLFARSIAASEPIESKPVTIDQIILSETVSFEYLMKKGEQIASIEQQRYRNIACLYGSTPKSLNTKIIGGFTVKTEFFSE
jgi:hypothetical protein